jgi:hypothetical protein
MPTETIANDATIGDVLATLDNAEEYVRRLLSTMGAMRPQHGAVVVRIGITGKGVMPNYRIDHAGEPSRSISAFDGQTHKPFTDVRNIDTENWSTRSLTYDEVRGVLGQIRGYKA